jgi:hypothetical protein
MVTTILFVLSCNGSIEIEPLEFCQSSTSALYDPMHSDELLSYPDDFLTKPDANSPTGIRVDLSPEKAPWTTELGDIFAPIIEDVSTRSGFARLGASVIRFSGPVNNGPVDPTASLENNDIIWLDLSVDPPERVAFTSSLGEDQDQLILKPMKPMRSNAQQAVFITNSFLDLDGSCIAPAPLIASIIEGTAEPEFDTLSERFQRAIEASGIAAETISHMQVFTTQDDLGLLQDVADDIAQNQYSWDESVDCNGDAPTYCQGTFLANDYRTDGTIEGPAPQQQWSLVVHSWLPKDIEPPYPVIIYGHGINSRAEGASNVADIVSPLGIAVIAVDALHHGQHPTADPDASMPALIFLGINLSEFVFDSRGLRGSFDQSTADRLQLIQLLKQNPDIDRDGIADLNMDELIYYGISLGGVMGPQLMANSKMQAGVLVEAGGDLPVFTTDTTTVDYLDSVLEALVGPPDVFARLLPILQTAVDSSDPAIWGVNVMQERLDEEPIPDLLFPVCLNDDTVPPATAKALARSLDIPHLTPIFETVPMLEVQDGPLQNNLPSGATGAYFQFDRITNNGEVIPSTHDNLPNSPEAVLMIQHFLQTHLEGSAEIIDPYEELGTTHLME